MAENPYLTMLWKGLEGAAPALPYFVGIFAFIFAMKVMEAKFGRRARGRRYRRDWRNGRSRQGWNNVAAFGPRHDAIPKIPDAADQLRTVMQAEFSAQPLLNKSEARLFKTLDKMVLEQRPDWQVMAQVSLGEILRCKDSEAFKCINSKRVDLLIVDENCQPLHAIEYQGGGHYKGAHATAARDAVKKEALRRAGIGYEEIVGGHHTPAELRRLVDKLIQQSGASA